VVRLGIYGALEFDLFVRSGAMKRPGPPPTPTAVLAARGSRRGKDRPAEVGYPAGAPPCPKCLPKEAKAEWRRVARLLLAAGVLQTTDLAALASYCRSWAEWIKLTEDSAGWNYSNESDRKKARLLAEAEKRVVSFAELFGFSPSARVRVPAVKQEQEEVDEVEQFLSRRGRTA
jgi:P27 family predicted phage terminase small subunit